jgi:hypothetical protein
MTPREGEGAAFGALGGAAVGALTGAAVTHHHTEGALIGAGIGAVAGGVGGYLWGKTQERQLPDEPPQVAEQSQRPVAEVGIQVLGLAADPQSIPAGGKVEIRGLCQTYGRAEPLPAGTMCLFRDGTLLVESQLQLSYRGRSEFVKTIVMPASSQPGDYRVDVQLQYGPAQTVKSVSFRVY